MGNAPAGVVVLSTVVTGLVAVGDELVEVTVLLLLLTVGVLVVVEVVLAGVGAVTVVVKVVVSRLL